MKASIAAPPRISRLPKDQRGYHVPWFVAWINGVPDFRVADAEKVLIAVREKRCWLCGEYLGKYLAFPIGPMCAVNRISAEPPSHRDCAIYAVQVCPFLVQPKMVRRETQLPAEIEDPAGRMIRRNPGVILVWVTLGADIFQEPNGLLFRVDDPTETLWFSEGRPATRDEVLASMESGFPILLKDAEAESTKAVAELHKMYARAQRYLPGAP